MAKVGGEEGIRTPGSLPASTVFKTAALNHSATSPLDVARHPSVPIGSITIQVTTIATHSNVASCSETGQVRTTVIQSVTRAPRAPHHPVIPLTRHRTSV